MSMNKLTVAAAVVFALGSASVFAEDDVPTTPLGTDIGLITFDGAVTDTTCKITTNNGVEANNVTITLPVVTKADVEGTDIDTGTGSKEFELNFSECPDTVSKASATFTSQQFAELSNGTLKSDPTVSGSAENVSLALYNNAEADKTRVQVGLPANNTQIAAITAGSGYLAFRVAYVPSNDWAETTNPVTAGKVSSNATFTMSYN